MRRTSSFARLKIANTSATIMSLGVYCDYPSGQKFVKIIKDGTTTITYLETGLTYLQIVITSITAIEVIAGPQGDVEGDVQGVYFYSVQFFGGSASVVTPTIQADRVLIYGDSITQGGATVNSASGSWGYQLRADLPVIIDGWSGREFWGDCDTDAHRTALVARWAEAQPSSVWLAIGYNDYANNTCTPNQFEVAYADLLDKTYVALPNAEIYAQTMLDAWSEVANAGGYTLPNYRTAIANAQSVRSAWCTLVDGPAILDGTTQLLDGIHPNVSGHASYYTYSKLVLVL